MQKGKIFLATTAISSFWEEDSNMLMLGPWCLAGNNRLLEKFNFNILESPWKPTQRIKEAADYCSRLYEKILPQLTERLNALHKVCLPVKYWGILIGPWLLHFIGVLYERHTRIKNALQLYPDFYTFILPGKADSLKALDTADFLCQQVNEDDYNLKLFSLVLSMICPQNTVIKERIIKTKANSFLSKQEMFYPGIQSGDNCVSIESSIYLTDMHSLSGWDKFYLMNKCGRKSIQLKDFPAATTKILDGKYNLSARRGLTLDNSTEEFLNLLNQVIPQSLPMSYVENFRIYRESVQQLSDFKKLKAIGSASAWYFKERFKFFAAEAVLKGIKLIEFQHGGGFGSLLANPGERTCLEKDIFYTWGWQVIGNKKVKVLPSSHLSKIKDSYCGRIDKLLFVGMTLPRYHHRFYSITQPDDMPRYLSDKKNFLQSLDGQIIDRLIYRPFPDEYGWKDTELVMSLCPNAVLLQKGNLVNWMKKAKLVIIDHAHTSFLEALVINVPSVLYWNREVYLMRPEAEEYFELLRKAGILFDDPQAAAQKVNQVYPDPKRWWQDYQVQQARNSFCEHFALSRRDWKSVWAKEFREFLN